MNSRVDGSRRKWSAPLAVLLLTLSVAGCPAPPIPTHPTATPAEPSPPRTTPLEPRVITVIDKADGAVILLSQGGRDGLTVGRRGHICGRYAVTITRSWGSRSRAHVNARKSALAGCRHATFSTRPAATLAVSAAVVSWIIRPGGVTLTLDRGLRGGLFPGRVGGLCGEHPVTIAQATPRTAQATTTAPRDALERCREVLFPARKPRTRPSKPAPDPPPRR